MLIQGSNVGADRQRPSHMLCSIGDRDRDGRLNNFAQTELALSQLLGLPLLYAGRAASLLWVHFGDVITIPDLRGGTRTVGSWALHVECPWRLTWLDGIVTGSGDIWEPPVLGEHGRDENFDADRDRTRFDTRMRDFISQFQGVCVRKITTDHAGGFRLCIGRSNVLEVFPVNSQDIDCWRLFRPGNTTEHFVVTGVRTIGPSEIALAEQLSHQEGNSV